MSLVKVQRREFLQNVSTYNCFPIKIPIIIRLSSELLHKISRCLSFSTKSHINKLPHELFQKIATYLSSHDYWNATLVCRFWFHMFQRPMYEKISVCNDLQFNSLIDALSINGNLVKELHFVTPKNHTTTKYINEEALTQVQLGNHQLAMLIKLCPLVEGIFFDPSRWNDIIRHCITLQWKYIRSCSIVPFKVLGPYFFQVFGYNLTQLHITHSLIELKRLTERLSHLPGLKVLTLETLFISIDYRGEQIKLDKHLEQIHGHLPQLEVFKCISSNMPLQEIPTDLHEEMCVFAQPAVSVVSLTLCRYVDSFQWFPFIIKNYPNLQELDISGISASLETTKWRWEKAIVKLLEALPLLKTLNLGGRSMHQLFSKEFFITLQKSIIQNINIDLKTCVLTEVDPFLLLLGSHGLKQLRKLGLRTCGHMSNDTRLLKNLLECQGLVSLELKFSKDIRNTGPLTLFSIDYFLEDLPQLKSLSLDDARVQVTHYHSKDSTLKKSALEELNLNYCTVDNHEVTFEYISAICPKLKQVKFFKFFTKLEWTIDLKHSRLQKLVLSPSEIYASEQYTHDYIGIEINDKHGKQMVWCNRHRPAHSIMYALNISQEKHQELNNVYELYKSTKYPNYLIPGNETPSIGVLTIHCKSVAQIFLDNLKLIIKNK